jgi:hypothetical protein
MVTLPPFYGNRTMDNRAHMHDIGTNSCRVCSDHGRSIQKSHAAML